MDENLEHLVFVMFLLLCIQYYTYYLIFMFKLLNQNPIESSNMNLTGPITTIDIDKNKLFLKTTNQHSD